jgi:hypothetical protein
LAAAPTQCGANNFATGIAAKGNAPCLQPASTNLSDSRSLVRTTQLFFSSAGSNAPTGWFVGAAGTSSSESNVQQITAIGGHITAVDCYSHTAPTASGATYTLRKNEASLTAVCSVAAGSKKGSVAGLRISFAAGDLLDILVGGPNTDRPVSVALAVTP